MRVSAPATSAPAAADSAAVTADAAARTHQADALASSLQETYDDLVAAAARRGGDGQDLGRVDDRAAVGAHAAKSFAEIGDREEGEAELADSLGLQPSPARFLTGSREAPAPRRRASAIRDPDQFGDARLPGAPRARARGRRRHAAASDRERRWARTTR